MDREGDTRGFPLTGPALRQAGCDVIPVYRDLRQLQKCKSQAGPNVKKAKKMQFGAVVVSDSR